MHIVYIITGLGAIAAAVLSGLALVLFFKVLYELVGIYILLTPLVLLVSYVVGLELYESKT